MEDIEEVKDTAVVEDNAPRCPECGAVTEVTGHCVLCHDCGFSLCGL
jgi:tRNA(Ile2) C34 agmatinyltransferase TiaS